MPKASDPIMWRRSIRSFRHLEHQNTSIIDAMGICIRIRKNVTEKRQTEEEQRTEKPITEAPLIAIPIEHWFEPTNSAHSILTYS